MRKYIIPLAAIVVAFVLSSAPASAQSSLTYDGARNYGISPCNIAVCGAAESAASHGQNGFVAGQVLAARRGQLTPHNFYQTIETVGQKNYVSNNITGNNNSSNMASNQSGSNAGTVANSGQNKNTGAGGSVGTITQQ